MRALLPNAVTALALCSGLTGIRFAILGDWEKAVAMVLLAALPFAAVVTVLCLCAFPFIERPFMFSDWPRIVWTALCTASVRPLAALFVKGR